MNKEFILLAVANFCVVFLLFAASVEKTIAQPSLAIRQRIDNRSFPSIFQAWNAATNLPQEPTLTTAARHDLIFHAPSFFHLKWQEKPDGLATELVDDSIPSGLEMRQKLLKLNPDLILLCEIRHRDAHHSYLPADHPWWMRDALGNRIVGWAEGNYYKLDYHNQEFREALAARAAAVVASGVVDGVMLDWWHEDDSRVALARQTRKAIGDDALILVNANDRQAPRSAKYVNGLFMECYRSQTADDWRKITSTLAWAEQNLRSPRINCLESWYHRSRQDLSLMRAITTLSLTHSQGYVLFSDPNDLPTGDHLHDWYPFWDTVLGKPIEKQNNRNDGSISRRFENGIAIYNPMGNRTVTVQFETAHRSAASGKVAHRHNVGSADGDLLIPTQPK